MPTIPSDHLVKSLTNDLADFFKSKGITNFQGPDDVDWISIDDETSYKNRYNSISNNNNKKPSSLNLNDDDENNHTKKTIKKPKTVQISTLLPDYQRPNNRAMPDPVSNVKDNSHEQNKNKDQQKNNSINSLSEQDLLELKPILKSASLLDQASGDTFKSSELLSEIENKNLQLLKKMLELTNFSPETIENLLSENNKNDKIKSTTTETAPLTTSTFSTISIELESDSLDPTSDNLNFPQTETTNINLLDENLFQNIQNHTENAKTLQTASIWLNGSNKLNQWSQKNTVGVILICIAVLAIFCIPCLLIQIITTYVKKRRGINLNNDGDDEDTNKSGKDKAKSTIKSKLPIKSNTYKNVKNVFRNSSVTSTMPLNMSNNSEGSIKCSFPDLRFSSYKQKSNNKNAEHEGQEDNYNKESPSSKEKVDPFKLQYRSSIETQHTVSTRVPSLQTTMSKQESLSASQFNSLNRSIHDHVIVNQNNNSLNSSQKVVESSNQSSQYLETVAGRLKRKVSLDDIRVQNQSTEKNENEATFYTLPRSGQNKSNPSSQKQNLNYYNMTKPKPVTVNAAKSEEAEASCISKNNFQPYPIFVSAENHTTSNTSNARKPKTSKKTSRKLAYDDSFLSFRPTCYLTHSKSSGDRKSRPVNNNNKNNAADDMINTNERNLRRHLSRSVNDLDQFGESDLRPSPYRLEVQSKDNHNRDQVYERPQRTQKQKVKVSKSYNPEAKNRAMEKILLSNSKSMKIEKGKVDNYDDQRLFVSGRNDRNKGSSVFIGDYFIHADPVV